MHLAHRPLVITALCSAVALCAALAGCAPQAEEKGASAGPGATASCAPGKLATQIGRAHV